MHRIKRFNGVPQMRHGDAIHIWIELSDDVIQSGFELYPVGQGCSPLGPLFIKGLA